MSQICDSRIKTNNINKDIICENLKIQSSGSKLKESFRVVSKICLIHIEIRKDIMIYFQWDK